MKRTLTVTLDDEQKTITTCGENLFSITELFGLGEHIRLKAMLVDIDAIRLAEAQAAAKPKARARKAKPRRSTK